MVDPDEVAGAQRRHVERSAVLLLGVGSLILSIVCGAIIVSGWFAGVMDDRFERWFWGGAVAGLAMVIAFAFAAMPGGSDDRNVIRRVTALIRIGLVLLIISPVMCIGAMIADFYL